MNYKLDQTKTNDFSFSLLEKNQINSVVEACYKGNWQKPVSLFENYLKQQKAGKRIIWLAFYRMQFAGYITLVWDSSYEPFANKNIPEIVDLNVLPQYRKLGIGSRLMELAEIETSKKSSVVGIGVGLYGGNDGGYGMAQRLYIKRGYVPDGKGATYNYRPIMYGEAFPLDDNLVLWFTKKL